MCICPGYVCCGEGWAGFVWAGLEQHRLQGCVLLLAPAYIRVRAACCFLCSAVFDLARTAWISQGNDQLLPQVQIVLQELALRPECLCWGGAIHCCCERVASNKAHDWPLTTGQLTGCNLMVCVQLSCVAGHNTSRCVLAQLWCACLASLVIQLQLFDVLVCVCA